MKTQMKNQRLTKKKNNKKRKPTLKTNDKKT